jgi:phospholipid/cholesterol/gamma-HCH transport system substrate-binding protein
MMQSRTIEVAVGAFVALGLAALLMLALQVSNLSTYNDDDGYEVSARFTNIGGLRERSKVAVAGVRIGRVESIDYDEEGFEAVVHMRIESRYDKLPLDTSASIFTAGLLGENFVSLEPGGDIEYLEDGGEITLTQSALVLEQVIGQFLFSKAQEGGNQ